jgi:hypothetical protein
MSAHKKMKFYIPAIIRDFDRKILRVIYGPIKIINK